MIFILMIKECKAFMFLSFVLFPVLFNDTLSNTLFIE
jgi:hypothetical protein